MKNTFCPVDVTTVTHLNMVTLESFPVGLFLSLLTFLSPYYRRGKINRENVIATRIRATDTRKSYVFRQKS